MSAAKLQFENQTLREIVHTSIGSDTVRVRLSNAYGKQTVDIGSAHVALRAKGSEITAGSDRVLTFDEPPRGLRSWIIVWWDFGSCAIRRSSA